MRTGKAILFGTHFFCVLEQARFLHTWALGEMLVFGVILPYLRGVKREQTSKCA